MTDAPMTPDDVAEAAEYIQEVTLRRPSPFGFVSNVRKDHLRALLASHEAQAAEIEILRGMLFRECNCMKVQQDESCPIGYPSLLCDECDGKGHINLLSEHKAVLSEVVDHALGCGAFDDDTPLWRKVAEMTERDPETGNALTRAQALKEKQPSGDKADG